jgi:hypothetical protein
LPHLNPLRCSSISSRIVNPLFLTSNVRRFGKKRPETGVRVTKDFPSKLAALAGFSVHCG